MMLYVIYNSRKDKFLDAKMEEDVLTFRWADDPEQCLLDKEQVGMMISIADADTESLDKLDMDMPSVEIMLKAADFLAEDDETEDDDVSFIPSTKDFTLNFTGALPL
jgi:hypothetical protein